MKKKLKLKKRIKIFIVFILLIIIIIILFYNNNKDLKSIGYNALEIESIKKLTKEEISQIKKYKYNENLVYIIESKNYNPNKLNLYLEGINKYGDIEYLKIFNLINDTDFDKNKFDEYIKYLRDYNNYKGIIKYVNNYIDKNIEIDETTLSLIEQKYFIIDYIDRYKNYYNKTNLEYEEIIRRVNSNLDFEFYIDSIPANTNKDMYSLINKFYYLDKDYLPNNLQTISGKYARDTAQIVDIAGEAFIKMSDKASENGLTIKITTGYRSYDFQATLYNNYVKTDGIKEADTYSARPGYSEHQLGYSMDLTNAYNVGFNEFDKTKEYEWLENNAHKYGFILRYPKDKEYITGYTYESWHYRYVGVEIATYIYENNLTYEEYYAYFLR